MTTKILSEEEIDALVTAVNNSNVEERIKEIDCCEDTQKECLNNRHPPSFCHYCGKNIEDKPEPDPWLIPGWPYEVWNEKDKRLLYFRRHDFSGFYFTLHPDDEWGEYYKNYRPIGTPLDYAPDWATHIHFNHENYFKFFADDSEDGLWLPWRNCPKELRGKTLPIPDWAREKKR